MREGAPSNDIREEEGERILANKDPFSERIPLENTGHLEISVLKDAPEVVVRKEKLRLEGVSDDGPTSEKTLAYIAAGKGLFEDLRAKYGVAVPDFQYVIGEGDADGKPWLYTMTERIDGKDLSNVESFEEEQIEKIDTALCAIE